MIWKVSPLGSAAPFCCLLYFFLFLSISYTRCLWSSSLSHYHLYLPQTLMTRPFLSQLVSQTYFHILFSWHGSSAHSHSCRCSWLQWLTNYQKTMFYSSLSSVLPPFPDVPRALEPAGEYYPPSQKGEINKWNSNAIYWKCWLIQSRELGKRTAMCLDRRINLENIESIWQGKQVARKGTCGRMLTMIDSSACCRDMQCI